MKENRKMWRSIVAFIIGILLGNFIALIISKVGNGAHENDEESNSNKVVVPISHFRASYTINEDGEVVLDTIIYDED